MMAKEPRRKLYYYEALMQVDMGYIAPDQRRERWKNRVVPTSCMHSYRFLPVDPNIPITKQRRSWLVTDRPLGDQYTEETHKIVDRYDWRSQKRIRAEHKSKVKFRLLDEGEVSGHIKDYAIELPLIESCYETIGVPLSEPLEVGNAV
jgi:hypothetical protein